MSDDKPIIVIKKKGGHGGHHGGAWKVAYADFVTAMMAFFMVMWLVNSAETATRQSIASFFRRPGLFQEGSGTPLMMGEAGILNDAYVPPHPYDMKTSTGKGQEKLEGLTGSSSDDASKLVDIEGVQGAEGLIKGLEVGKGYNVEVSDGEKEVTGVKKSQLDDVKKELDEGVHKTLKTDPTADKKAAEARKEKLDKIAKNIGDQLKSIDGLNELLGQVEVKIESDGVLIEIMDTAKQSMFKSGSAIIEPAAQEAFAKVTQIVNKSSNKIDIIGHTDGSPFSSRRGGYSNWELSADRANAARRILELQGVERARITSVVGRADKELKFPDEPLSPSNRRITLKLKFDEKDLAKVDTPLSPEQEEKKEETVEDLQRKATEAWKKRKAEEEKINPKNPKDIVRGSKQLKSVELPDSQPSKVNPNTPPIKDLIFKESPVIGPPDPFTDY
ncbi:MAG: OmpA family protein [Bdellovibrionales bacterium]|nr:OmpA family protein [Bdellovibrionales bacterium]